MQADLAARHFRFGKADRVLQHVGDGRVLDLQADRPHELERLVHDLIRHLRFADDVVQQRLRVGRVGHGRLPLQQARHHFDAGERVLHFVRDRRRHLAERDEAIAEALALFELLDLREVLEEQRDAGGAAVLVAHVRQRVADHLARRLQPQLGAVRQVAQLERAVQHAHHVRVLGEHDGEVTADDALRALDLENSRGLAVHFGDVAVARDRQHAIAHAADQAAEETIGLPPRVVLGARTQGRGLRPPTGLGWHQGLFGERQRSEMRAFHGSINVPEGANAVPGSTHAKMR